MGARYEFTWRIENFSQLNELQYVSHTFTIGPHKWKLLVFYNGCDDNDCLMVYLIAVDIVDIAYAKFSLAVVNQINSNAILKKDAEYTFTEKATCWGFTHFVQLKELKDPGKGYIVNDTCIVQVEISLNLPLNSKQGLESNVVGEETSQEEQYWAEIIADRPTEPSKYPNAGQLFEKGIHCHQDGVLDDDKFEDVGGFKVLKTQALLYKKIWLKYGHIATSKILRDSYSGQVALVSGIMTSLTEMIQCMSVDKISTEVFELFECKINMAEDIEFNVEWMREWFEDVKKEFYMQEKHKNALVMQEQCLIAVMEQLTEAKDEFMKKLFGIETAISALLSETQMKNKKVSKG